MKKAQIGVEHTALISIVLVIIIVGIVRFSDVQKENAGRVYSALIDSEIDNLVATINRAPILGEGSRQSITVNLPEEFDHAFLTSTNRTIVFVLNNYVGFENMVFPLDYEVFDDDFLSTLNPGNRRVYVIALNDVVCLSNDNYCGEECGDGFASDSEICDLGDLKGNDCNSYNSSYSGGTLICNSDCSGFTDEYCTI